MKILATFDFDTLTSEDYLKAIEKMKKKNVLNDSHRSFHVAASSGECQVPILVDS